MKTKTCSLSSAMVLCAVAFFSFTAVRDARAITPGAVLLPPVPPSPPSSETTSQSTKADLQPLPAPMIPPSSESPVSSGYFSGTIVD